MKSVALHNLGCKVNAYELEVMQQKLQDRGYKIVPFDSDADIYIVNTCTVTNIADRKSRQMLHRAKHRNPDAVVVAVGCFVQAGEENRMDDCIDLAVGNQHKKDIVEILEAYLEEHTADASAVTDMPAARNASTSCGSARQRGVTVPPTTHIGRPSSAQHQVVQRPANRLPTAVRTRLRA